jgi:tRNA threonylcarbamoyladenosine modification (KEOPS) complex Cgi121 subunit
LNKNHNNDRFNYSISNLNKNINNEDGVIDINDEDINDSIKSLSVNLLPKNIFNIILNLKKEIQQFISIEIINNLYHIETKTKYLIEKVIENLKNVNNDRFISFDLKINFLDKKTGMRAISKEIKNNVLDESIIIIGKYYLIKMNEEISFPNFIIFQINEESIANISCYFYEELGIEKIENIKIKISAKIEDIIKNINKEILLNDLNLTRICSNLLFYESTNFEENSSNYDKFLLDSNYFKKNMFECGKKHAIYFNLQKRLDAKLAISSIKNTIFNPLRVTNRDNFYVYKNNQNNIYYMRFFSNENSIELQIFGKENPNIETINYLQKLIENKINSLTMNIFSLYLKENFNNLVLDDFDYEYLRPKNKSNDTSFYINIPNNQDIDLFYILFKKNLLNYMRVLSLKSETKKENEFNLIFLDSNSQISEINESSDSSIKIKIKGISLINLNLNKNKFEEDVKISQEESNEKIIQFMKEQIFFQNLNPEYENTKIGNSIKVKIWNKGNININSLVDQIILSANQTILESTIEKFILEKNINLIPNLFYDVVSKNSNIKLPTINTFNRAIKLSNWTIYDLILETKDAILNNNLNIINIIMKDSENYIQIKEDKQLNELLKNVINLNNINIFIIANNSNLYETLSNEFKMKNFYVISITIREIEAISYNFSFKTFDNIFENILR